MIFPLFCCRQKRGTKKVPFYDEHFDLSAGSLTPSSTLSDFDFPAMPSSLSRHSAAAVLRPSAVVSNKTSLAQPRSSLATSLLSPAITPNAQNLMKNWRDARSPRPSERYVAYVEKIHWITTKKEIAKLFDGINIVDGSKGIHFVVMKETGIANNAFVEVASEADYKRILAFNQSTSKMKVVSGKYETGRFIKGETTFRIMTV